MMRLVRASVLAAALLGLLTIVACGGRAEADKIGAAEAGAIEMGIDTEITGNTANALGTVETCWRVNGSSTFDGVADVTIDVVVQGDTQKPMAYDAFVVYEPTKVDPVSWNDLIKLPGGTGLTTKAPPQLNATAVYLDLPGNGIAGNGTVIRIDLDVNFTIGPTVATFSFAWGAYKDFANKAHPTTTGTGMLAINQDCPGVVATPTATPGTPTASPTATPLPTPPPGTIMLAGGWNNACYVGPEQPIEGALTGVVDQVLAVYRMRADQGFDGWFPNKPEASTITIVSPYQPLFILMGQYAFWPHEPSGTPPPFVSLASGWNSVCYTGQTKSAEDATAGVAGGLAIMYQLSSDQGWRYFVPAKPEMSNIAQLSQYDTVLMLVNQEGGTTWTFDP
jgi:hypothetical protein